MKSTLLSVRLQYEHDVVAARQRARQLAELLGFDAQHQTRLATAVSEIARNAFTYAGGGLAEFVIEGTTSPQLLSVRISDSGKGISNLEEILEGRYQSSTGLGLGILGAKRLMDTFSIDTGGGKSTTVVLGKLLPRKAPLITPETISSLSAELARQRPKDLLGEFRDQNQELLRTLNELRARQEELIVLNRELEDTNRGVVALYTELDEKADHLRRADEIKSRFLSNMSHEFRTPLNSILALSRILLDRTDGDLLPEQEIQVKYIRKSAESLFELVNDLLDLAKVQAGKITVHPVEFEADKLFGALRGMLRPLLVGTSVNLVFEDPEDIPAIFSDEGKVSQVLRNFISNALKFTEAGEVSVSAAFDGETDSILFRVKDTGIGIPSEHLETIFLEFTQVDNPIQRKVKGTGLGLPLSRKLATLLGGAVEVESQLGTGSVFSLKLPRNYRPTEPSKEYEAEPEKDTTRLPVLLVEDHFETRLIYEKQLRASPWQIISARSVREAENILQNIRPAAIVLDIVLQGEDTWELLARLKSGANTKSIPILVATNVDDRGKALSLGADAFATKPLSAEDLREYLGVLTQSKVWRKVLLVDDEEVSRYLMKQAFGNARIRFVEASDGSAGIEAARKEKPDLTVMDLGMPGMNGFEVIRKMKDDPELATMPLIVATARVLSETERRALSSEVLAVLSKESLSDGSATAKLRTVLTEAGLNYLMPEKQELPSL